MRKLAFLIYLSAIVWAGDFKTGLEAYQKGDFAAALKEWQPIAEGGDPNAQYNLGLLHARGQGVPQDYAEAAKWYEKAAEQGVPAAQYNLGLMYANGQGVKASVEQAAKWFLKAAEQGVVDAQAGLGNVYHEGEGAFRNYAEAEKWYRKAAEQGVASAAFHLGVMYDLGQGVTRNYPEAMQWYRKAADSGYAAGMANLGILYYNGQGAERNLMEAYGWFDRAQKLGDPRAGELLNATARKLRPGDLKKAQLAAAKWEPPAKQAPVQVAEAQLFKPQTATPPAAAPETQAANTADRQASASAAVFTGVERVIAVGDAHGDFEQFTAVLASAGLIDGHGDWVGGKTHLVQTGDVLDRGPDSRPIMDLLMKLEKQAAAAGGAVHALVGNHEAMNVYGDLRYVSPGELASYGTAAAQRAAFGPEGAYGRWIRSHAAVIKIDRTLFLHAGLGAKYVNWSLDKINDGVRTELNDLKRLHGGIVTDEEGPLWYRGLANGDEAQLEPMVEQLLRQFDVDRIVIGHSYAQAAITPRFGGKVVLIDIGLSRVYDNVGKVGCLEIAGGRVAAIHRGQRLELPKDAAEMLRYLKEAAALDPAPSPLLGRIAELEK